MVFVKPAVLVALSASTVLCAQAAAISRHLRAPEASIQQQDVSISISDRIYFGKMFIPVDQLPNDNDHLSELQQRGLLDGILGAVPGILQVVGGLVTDVTNAVTGILGSVLITKPPSAEHYAMSASQTESSTVYLQVVSNATYPSSNFNDLMVTLRMPMFDVANVSMIDMCITYDPAPAMQSAMTVALCMNNATDHASQIFTYEPVSGAVHPIFALNSSDSLGLGDPSNSTQGMNGTNVMVFKPTVSALPVVSQPSMHNETGHSSNNTTTARSSSYPCMDPSYNMSSANTC